MRKEFWFVLAGIIAFFFGAYQAVVIVNKDQNTPHLRVGDCMIPDLNETREAWEEPPLVFKIAEIGQHAYRVTNAAIKEDGGISIAFNHESYYKKVQCP